ncbi:MAG: autotransporter outer membrane beta-barrel domain-containing protein [Planctomycetaceae bacterium]|jgi:uncharacterized protein with beta-barrel porin domain|nr:autotransporter outer membrane beta-barrel domain-containing protein [Planctomycetaceae bacterium]
MRVLLFFIFFVLLLYYSLFPPSVSAQEYLGQNFLHRYYSRVPSDWQMQRFRIWVRPFGNWSRIGSSNNGAADLTYYSYGAAAGIDRQVGQHFLHGFSFGGSESKADTVPFGRQFVKPDFSNVFGSVYCRFTHWNCYADLETGLGSNEQSLGNNTANHTAMQWNVNGEIGVWKKHGLGKIEPYLGLRYVSLDTEPSAESKTTLLAGLRYSWKKASDYSVMSPRCYAGVIQELGGRNLMNAGVYVDSPAVFAVPGYKAAQTRLFFGGGLTASMGNSLDVYFRYTAEAASDQMSHSILTGMNWNF